MASAQASWRCCVFFSFLALAATLLPAQTPQADPIAPPYVQFQKLISPGQLAFLNGYAGRPTKELMKDKQFKAVRKLMIPRTEYHYGRDMSLSDAVDMVLDGSPLVVNVHDGYVLVSGKQGPYLHGRGFLWFDLQEGFALGAFYFSPTNGEPSPTLTVFSNQLSQTSLALGEFPTAFIEDLKQWTMVSSIPEIAPQYFIPENGKKYVLEHDEDYCMAPAGTPPPAADAPCMRANLAAADADMNAGYFMKETHNAANATAWMLGPEQVAWLATRDRTCMGAGGLGCRVRMTRERVRIILGPAPMPRPRPIRVSR